MKYYLGIDLGGTGIKAAVIDEAYRIMATDKCPTLAQRPFEEVVADMAAAAQGALDKAGVTLGQLEHIGVGVPSTLYPDTRKVVYANNLDWRNVDVVGELQKHLAVPVYIANDADCAAYGEVLAGGASEYRNVLMLTLGTGVGGGIIWDKKIFLGGTGFGIEPGHVIVHMNGEPCTCGQLGCLEAYASVTGLIRDTKRAMEQHPDSLLHQVSVEHGHVSGRTAFDAAKQGDTVAQAVVDAYIESLAIGIANFITLLRPEAVLLGGGVAGEGENLLAPLREQVRGRVYAGDMLPETPILQAKLGNDAGLIGAAFLGIQFERV